jgi:hypothetical protein
LVQAKLPFSEGKSMMCLKERGLRASVAAAALFALAGVSSGSVAAQPVNSLPNGPVACHAVQRIGWGSWRILAPMTVETLDGPLSFRPGETFAPGFFMGRVEPTAIFERNCGNLPILARGPAARRYSQTEGPRSYTEGAGSSTPPEAGGPHYFDYWVKKPQ